MEVLKADYLVVGAGASGVAFIDELIHNTTDVTVIIVDKRAKPGGHWNDAYPFVRLHQPALTYGVNSKPLGQGGADLCTKAQILAYYELVMDKLVATGRVSYYPKAEYLGNGKFASLLDENLEYEVQVKRKIVDATRLLTNVPSTKPPEFGVGEDVNLIPINGLVDIKKPWKKYLVIGAGKTGIDAILYLLDHDVNPAKISWVISNDCWYFSRKLLTNIDQFAVKSTKALLSSDANTVDELYLKYEEEEVFLRLDKSVNPTKFRAATVSLQEVEKLRLIKNVIREGRIEKIEKEKIFFKNGKVIPTDCETLHINCSAAGSTFKPIKKIFSGSTINLQMVLSAEICFSAAIIAAVEIAHPDDDDKKNQICTPVPAYQDKENWFPIQRHDDRSQSKITEALGVTWMRSKRLCRAHHMSLFQFVWVSFYLYQKEDKILKKMDRICTDCRAIVPNFIH